jgi:hypothetical protein
MNDGNNKQEIPDLTLSIVTGGNRDLVIDFLRSVKHHTKGISYETIVLEYKKTDDTADAISGEFPDARILESDKVRGFGENHNAILHHARGRYVAILNDDMVLKNNALGLMVEYADEHPEAGIIAPRLYNPDGTIQPSSYVSWSTPFAEFMRMLRIDGFLKKDLCGGRDFPTVFGHCSGRHHETREVSHLMGACLVVRRDLMVQVMGFDERFVMGFEDQDLCRRLHNLGHKIVYYPEAEIIHLGHRSIGKEGSDSRIKMLASRLYYHNKWYGEFGGMPVRFILMCQAFEVILGSFVMGIIPGHFNRSRLETARGMDMLRYLLGLRGR